MNTPTKIPALCATLTDADLDEIEASLTHYANTYKTAGHAFSQRVEGFVDSLNLLKAYRKKYANTTRPFCLIPSTFFAN